MNDTEFPEELVGRYDIIEKIGEGGMGNVYLAQDKKLPRKVAVKEVRSEFLNNEEVFKRIERESQLHAKIGNHENIVTLYDVIQSDRGTYLILEFVVGETLAKIVEENLENGVRLSESVVIDVVQQLLKALKRIHLHGVVHRDIKPENLLIAKDDNEKWQVKLMDFGVAKSNTGASELTKLTQVGSSSPGTPSYMAPEQIDPSTFGEVSTATDLYSVGIIFYELMAGTPPFSGTLTEVYGGHLMREVSDLASTSKMTDQWRDVICKALEKSQKDRFQSTSDFSNAIRDCLEKAGESMVEGSLVQAQTSPDTLKTRVTQPDVLKTQVAGGDALALLLESAKEAKQVRPKKDEKADQNVTSPTRNDSHSAISYRSLTRDLRSFVGQAFDKLRSVLGSGGLSSWGQHKAIISAIVAVSIVTLLWTLMRTEKPSEPEPVSNMPVQSLESYNLVQDVEPIATPQTRAVLDAFELARSSPQVTLEEPQAPQREKSSVRREKGQSASRPKPSQNSRFTVEETQSKKIQD